MDFRWKGYQKPVNMGGQDAYDASVSAIGGNGTEPVSVQPFEEERRKLAALESQLSAIDEQIAQFDRENPGFGSGMAGIAAKRAEAGDMGAYDSIVNGAMSREQGAAGVRKAGEAGVWNSIDEARKIAFGLDDTSDETREARIANIRVMLDKARRDANAAGIDLPTEWHELDRKISQVENGTGDEKKSLLQWGNTLWTKLRNGTLSDSDISEMENYIAKNPNGELSKELQALVSQYRGKTGQAINRYREEVNEAKRMADEAGKLSKVDLAVYWNGLDAKSPLKKHYLLRDGKLVKK